MATDKLYTTQLKQYLKDFKSFKTEDIASFYQESEPELKKTTLNWRIYHLVEKGILERVGKGVFRLGKSTPFISNLSKKAKILYNKISSEFPFIEFCIWDTSLFNEFSLHQSNKRFIIIETEKEVVESIFLFLKEQNNQIFLNPNPEIMEQYILNLSFPVIVKPLISEAPLQQIKKYHTVTIEKVLVDLYCDEDLFYFYQGREKRIIFREAYGKYTINNTRLLRYASRRGKKKEIENYINQIHD